MEEGANSKPCVPSRMASKFPPSFAGSLLKTSELRSLTENVLRGEAHGLALPDVAGVVILELSADLFSGLNSRENVGEFNPESQEEEGMEDTEADGGVFNSFFVAERGVFDFSRSVRFATNSSAGKFWN
jgi:hypothetical protein